MTYLILIISIVLIILAIYLFIQANKKKIDLNQVQQKKQKIENEINLLTNQKQKQTKDLQDIKDSIKSSQNEIKYINKIITEKQQEHKKILRQIEQQKRKANNFYIQQKQIVEKQLEDFKQISSKAAENYFNNLQEAYKTADAAHTKKMTKLKEEQDKAAASLNKIVETRNAAQTALLKQKEIKENKNNYRLNPSTQDLQDIHSLEKIKQTFHKPRVISMLIWQYYYQPIAKKQFPIILQSNTKIGIYKITNINTNQAYIGQSLDIYKRWTDHCKAGLGIDTPVGNKLYQAMLQDGLQNFTFELLCQCSKQELDEKEKYFIELYQANLFGYNGNTGIKNKN